MSLYGLILCLCNDYDEGTDLVLRGRQPKMQGIKLIGPLFVQESLTVNLLTEAKYRIGAYNYGTSRQIKFLYNIRNKKPDDLFFSGRLYNVNIDNVSILYGHSF